MKCIVVWNLDTDLVEYFWWCSTPQEYTEMLEKTRRGFPEDKFDIFTEYEGSSSNYSHAAGYAN